MKKDRTIKRENAWLHEEVTRLEDKVEWLERQAEDLGYKAASCDRSLVSRQHFETVAAQRDQLAAKLHELGKKLQAPAVVQADEAIAAVPGTNWVELERTGWFTPDYLPIRRGWYEVEIDGMPIPAHWDGDAFSVLFLRPGGATRGRKFRLQPGQRWRGFSVP